MNNKKDIDDLIEYRADLPSDEAFIFSTWLAGYYGGNPEYKRFISEDDHFRPSSKFRRNIKYILSKPGVKVKIACLKEDPDVICAYSVIEARAAVKVLHWVFCKKAFRRFGIAKEIVPKDIDIVTHMTEFGKSIKPKEWDFDASYILK